ncbi:hypothetical protein RSC2_00993 [Bacillus paralicheniformis]|nr:hypothetical protein RSC1_03548 [Bacillus paralicheniformis]BCE09197.1 hypothetical protein RSC2_00993 [Bacillus paralicheniformis]BCE15342.1 hypothetical protein RSC3_02698 [Bacillus paralicheniformis]
MKQPGFKKCIPASSDKSHIAHSQLSVYPSIFQSLSHARCIGVID